VESCSGCYGNLWGRWCFNEVHGSYGVSLWKCIRRGWREFFSHTIFELGDGSKIRFSSDKWYEDHVHKDIFLDLYSIVCVKDASVAQIIWSYPMILINGI
jgi:hypothetical protein